MPSLKGGYVCRECGYATPKWLGRCPACGQWGSLAEEPAAGRPRGGMPQAASGSAPQPLGEMGEAVEERLPTGMGELDRVLGGGLVVGSLVLFGGEPGVGKSTLLLQAAEAWARHGKVLYVSAEESLGQIRLRASRLGIKTSSLYVLSESNLVSIREQVQSLRPDLLILDSVQTVYSPDIPSAPGSLVQVRECAAECLRLAKESNLPCLLVGHVTKEGYLAGPKALEHLVDAVLYLEGERYSSLRLLRAVKNRFGSTNEVGVFQMGERGLVEVPNPSAMFLAGRPGQASGSVVVAGVEGSRALLLELQALVTPTVFGNPRRLTTGLDLQRVLLLLAVLEKRCGLALATQDVYLNLAGGMRLEEPAADLGVCLAVASGLLDQSLGAGVVVAGEVGLTGEVRRVAHIDKRVAEAARLGLRKFLLPAANLEDLGPCSLELVGVRDLEEAFEELKLR
ncbi:MAG: DNA repair protein RadA [Moorellales bacterium]